MKMTGPTPNEARYIRHPLEVEDASERDVALRGPCPNAAPITEEELYRRIRERRIRQHKGDT